METGYPTMLATNTRDTKGGSILNRKATFELFFGKGAPDFDKMCRYVINSYVVISLFLM
jgi:hypothetical protein